MLETLSAMLVLQVMVLDSVATPMLLMPKSFGDVQLSGRLTGDPKPYKRPTVVPT